MNDFDNFGSIYTTTNRWFEDINNIMLCWTMNGYESFYAEVAMFCVTMAAFLLLIFTTNKRIKMMLSNMLPSLILASLQCIICPILSLMAIAHSSQSLQNNWYGYIPMLEHGLFVCDRLIGDMVVLEVIVFIVFCIFAVPMHYVIPLKVNALNFMAMFFSSMLFRPSIEVFIRAVFPNVSSIRASIAIAALVPFIYFILACLVTLFRRALSGIYSILKHLFMYVRYRKVHQQDIPSEKLDNKDDGILYI